MNLHLRQALVEARLINRLHAVLDVAFPAQALRDRPSARVLGFLIGIGAVRMADFHGGFSLRHGRGCFGGTGGNRHQQGEQSLRHVEQYKSFLQVVKQNPRVPQ